MDTDRPAEQSAPAAGAALRWAVTCAAGLLLALAGCTDEPEPPADAPHAVVVTGAAATYDFGYVEPESRHTASFELINNADRPLAIREAVTNCECLTIGARPDAVPPGGRGTVQVIYASSEKRQRYAGEVMLLTDAADRPRVRLSITAAVGLRLEATPAVVRAGRVPPDQERTVHVALHNHGATKVRITHGKSESPDCRADVPQVAIPAGRTVRMPVTVRGTGPPGPRRVRVEVHTDACHQPTVLVTVEYLVASEGPDPE